MKTQVQVSKAPLSILLKSLIFMLISSNAGAHPIIQYWQSRSASSESLILEPRFSNYTTSANFDHDSKAIPLLKDASVSRNYFDLNASYGISAEWSIFGRLSILSSGVQNSTTQSHSSFGLSDQLVGFSYQTKGDHSDNEYRFQFDAVLPGYTNSAIALDPFLGDQSIDITLGTFTKIPLSIQKLSIELGAGYTYRTKNYSSALPFSFMLLRAPVEKGFQLESGFRGQFSFESDQTSAAVAAIDQNKGAGGSYLINAINPSFLIIQAKIGYQTSSTTSFYGLVAAPLIEKNAPSGLQISIGAKFEFSTHRSEPHFRNRPKKNDSIKPIESYDLEARVLSSNDQLYLAKIDRGLDDGIQNGQVFDIFEVVEDTATQRKSEIAVARATVSSLKKDEAALLVVEYYRDQWIEQGFTAKRVRD